MSKKIENINPKILIVVASIFVSFLSLLPGLQKEMYVGNDLSFHIYRIQEMASNMINDGVYFPSLQANNLFGYGYLVDIFYPNLFLYPAAFLTILTRNPLTSLKILIFIYTIFTFYLSYFSAKITTKNEKYAFYFGVFYCLFPYRILHFYSNGFVGEFFAFSFLPLVIFGTNRLFKENKWKMLTIGMIGILYSHLITLLLSACYIALYFIINIKDVFKNFKIIINLFKATVTTVLVGSAFLLPFISYMRSDTYKYDLNTDRSGILAYGLINLPIALEIVILITLIFMTFFIYRKFKDRFENKYILKCLMIGVFSIYMVTKLFPWELCDYVPFLRNIQFSIRIINFISPFIVFIFVYFALCLKDMNKVFFYFFLCCIFTLMVITKARVSKSGEEIPNFNVLYKGVEGYQEDTYFDIIGGEYIPVSLSFGGGDLFDIQNDDLFTYNYPEFTRKVVSYELLKDNTLTTTLILDTNDPVDVVLPLLYYQNYRAYLNDNELEVFEKNGKVSIKDATSGTIIIKYEVSDLQRQSFVISLLSVIMFAIYNLKVYLKKYLKNMEKS